MRNTLTRALLCTVGLITTSVMAQTPEEIGLEIATTAKMKDTGWQDMQANMQMILRNSEGQESLREIRIKALEQLNDGDKNLTLFDKPLDVKGTAFLSFSHALGADDQWLYLPALKRVKRIASRNKSGPFMGSEFSFEDMSSFEVSKYTYKYLRDDPCALGTCFVIEQYPVDSFSGYTKRITWVDQTEYRLVKVEFYDRKDTLLKTLSFSGYQQYINKYWRPDAMNMVNHQSSKSTDLLWSEYQFKTGLSEDDFSHNALKRAR